MVFCHTFCAWGLSRPPSCSGTVATILVLGDCPDHHRARGLFRPLSCSGLSRPPSCSGTVPTTFVLGDCPDYGYSQGFVVFPMLRSGTAPTTLRPLLGDCSPRLHVICTHIQLRGIYFFSLRPCYKADTSPSSKLRDYIGTMHLPVQLVLLVRRLDSQLNWEFFLDPGTTCLRHLLPGSRTKWAHFTLR